MSTTFNKIPECTNFICLFNDAGVERILEHTEQATIHPNFKNRLIIQCQWKQKLIKYLNEHFSYGF